MRRLMALVDLLARVDGRASAGEAAAMIDALVAQIRSLPINREIAPKDQMYVAGLAPERAQQIYFREGQSALHTVVTALMACALHAGGEQPVASILDFGCGHGRVARYLRAGFPSAKLVVHDLN